MNNTASRHSGRDLLIRAGLILLTCLMIGAVLTGCASGKASTPKLEHNPDALTVGDENGLNKDQLSLIVAGIEKHDDCVTIRQMLVAALNGYDMTVEGFDDASLPEAHPESAPVYVMNILDKYKIETSATAETMTTADVQVLVNVFRTEVVTEEKVGFLTRLLMWIAIGFEWLINVLGFGSFVLGTLFFAIIVEILMLPLAIYQQKNTRRQARLRPKEMAIRNKYKGRNDQATQQKVQQEIQEMYSKEGINPLSSGCLPLLISLPIVLALYYIVIDPLKYMVGCSAGLSNALLAFATAPKAAGGLGLALNSSRGTIEILSLLRELGLDSLNGMEGFAYFTNSGEAMTALRTALEAHPIPSFNIGSINFGLTPNIGQPSWLWLVPVLTFGVYFGSSKLTRKFSYQPTTAGDAATGCSNNIMDISMPLISAWFTFMVPAAVGVYWMFKSVIMTLKQFIMNKVMPMPKFTEADYKAAERELAGKDKAKPQKKNGGAGNPNVRSLHHIDDEDYENVPAETSPKRKPAPYAEDDEPAEKPAETNQSSYAEGVSMKEDETREERKAKKNDKDKE